jgi:hypothetical protein
LIRLVRSLLSLVLAPLFLVVRRVWGGVASRVRLIRTDMLGIINPECRDAAKMTEAKNSFLSEQLSSPYLIELSSP